MVWVDIYVFMSLCLMFWQAVLYFLTKRQKDRCLGLIFLFLCLYGWCPETWSRLGVVSFAATQLLPGGMAID